MIVPIRAALLLALAAATGTAHSAPQERGNGIQRCEMADGTELYTDQPCEVHGATPAALEGELLRRLDRDRGIAATGSTGAASPFAAVETSVAATAASAGIAPAAAVARPIARPAPAAARGCARSGTQLAMDLQAAWSSGDVNRIAASYDWAGRDSREAASVMSRLESLAKLPLQRVRHFDTGFGGVTQVAGVGTTRLGSLLHLELGEGARTRTHDLRVREHNGCYFIRF